MEYFQGFPELKGPEPFDDGERDYPAGDLSQPEWRTDKSNAKRFYERHGGDVLWCEPWQKWLVWDGTRWATDYQRAVRQKAGDICEAVWAEALGLLRDADDSKTILAFAKYTASDKGINALLNLAKDEPGMCIMPEKLDSKPWLFNCSNVTVDLKTGKPGPHNKRDYLTKVCPHPYITTGSAKCELWNDRLGLILGRNEKLITFFRRLCGASLVGEAIEHILPIPYGHGSNGKSLVFETILEVLGKDYADKGAADLLLDSKGDRHPTEKADLHGKRLIVCIETDENRRLAESTVKELTGGDTVKARRMREDFWSFRPSHSLFLVTNHKPIVRGTDHGIWRRLRLIPFTQQFWDADKGESGPPDLQADKHLKDKLKVEFPGILKWLVDACLEWQKEGLGQPDEVTAATKVYQDSMDVLSAFLEECCIVQEGVTCKASDLRKVYEDWCAANGEYPVSGRRLGECLAERGITKRKSNGVWYSGLGIHTGGF